MIAGAFWIQGSWRISPCGGKHRVVSELNSVDVWRGRVFVLDGMTWNTGDQYVLPLPH
jgi:hypothetical protein